MPEYSRTFTVQAYQLAESLHDQWICPFSHSEKAKSYIPRAECPRIENLQAVAYELLERASGLAFKPITVRGVTYEQPALDL